MLDEEIILELCEVIDIREKKCLKMFITIIKWGKAFAVFQAFASLAFPVSTIET